MDRTKGTVRKYHQDPLDYKRLKPNNINKTQLNMIPAGSNVLEIGCATSYMGEYLVQKKNCQFFGIETDLRQAEVAVKQ